MAPRRIGAAQWQAAAHGALGSGWRLDGVQRLAGGTSKGVYRLTAVGGATVIAYLWDDSENWWPPTEFDGDPSDPFSPDGGLHHFEAARARLDSLGVRTPELYATGRAGTLLPADFAFAEDLPGEDLMDLSLRDPSAAAPAVARLGEALRAMRAYRAPRFGRVGFVDGGGVSRHGSCKAAALGFALRCLDGAAAHEPRIAAARAALDERLRELAAAVRPRAEYSVVHGELGFDHVRVDADGAPVVIDFEELLYFDVEWEHVFLKLRHSPAQYAPLAAAGLDADRLALYKLTQHLSLTAGPLRLLDGGFPDRAPMLAIAHQHTGEALAMLGR